MTHRKSPTDQPYWLLTASRNRPNGRTRTIQNLIARGIAETGQAPSDEELARLLAISRTRVRHHRKILGM